MLAMKVRIMNRRGFMTGSLRNNGIVTRSATSEGKATLSNPRASPVKGFIPSSSIEVTIPPMPDTSRVRKSRLTWERKVKRRK